MFRGHWNIYKIGQSWRFFFFWILKFKYFILLEDLTSFKLLKCVMEIFFDRINWEWNNNEKYEYCLEWKIFKILCFTMLKIFDSYVVFYFDKSDTNKILFDQNCHRQIPGVDVYCFGVSNDICMLCASMNVYQVFKGRPISGMPCYANAYTIIYSNSRLQIYWCMHVIAFTSYALIINKNWFENYN